MSRETLFFFLLFHCVIGFAEMESPKTNCEFGASLEDLGSTLQSMRKKRNLNLVVSFGTHYSQDFDQEGAKEYADFIQEIEKNFHKTGVNDRPVSFAWNHYRTTSIQSERITLPYKDELKMKISGPPLSYKRRTYSLRADNPEDPDISLTVILVPYGIAPKTAYFYDLESQLKLRTKFTKQIDQSDFVILNGHGSDVRHYCEHEEFRSKHPALLYLNGCLTSGGSVRTPGSRRFYLGNGQCGHFGMGSPSSMKLIVSFLSGASGKELIQSLPQYTEPKIKPVTLRKKQPTPTTRRSRTTEHNPHDRHVP